MDITIDFFFFINFNHFSFQVKFISAYNFVGRSLEFASLVDEYSTTGAALLIIQCHTSRVKLY